MHIKNIISIILMLATFCANAGNIRIALSGNGEYAVNQTFKITIEAQNVKGSFPQPNVPGCRVVSNSYRSESSVTSDSKGRAVIMQNDVMELYVQPVTAGKYTFGPVKIGNSASNTVSYTITGKSVAPSNQPSPVQTAPVPSSQTIPDVENEDIIIRATVSDKSPYVQQGIRYDVRLYFKADVNVTAYPQIEQPKFNNCTYEILPDNSNSHVVQPTMLNGKQYYTADLYSFIVYPTKPGSVIIEGGKNTVPVNRFNSVEVLTNNIELDVRPLPDADSHHDVNGIGEYSVTSELISKAFHTNEVGKIRFTVKGIGNPAFVSLPDLSSLLPDGFKLLKSESEITKEITADGVQATIVFDCSVIPSKTGVFDFPVVNFTFFNPLTGKWYEKSTASLTIDVKQGSQAESGEDVVSFNSQLQPLGNLQTARDFYISDFWYWLIYVLSIVGLLSAVVIYRRRLALLSDHDLLKHKKAGSVARKRLKAAHSAMSKKNTELFYDEVLKAVWGYLSDKLTIPTSDLSRNNISGELLAAGVSQNLTEDTIEFIDECEFAKYGTLEDSDIRKVYDRASHIFDALETEIKSSGAHSN